jgi:hypothetical protein
MADAPKAAFRRRQLIAGLKGGSVSETKAGGCCPPDQGYSADQARLIIQKFLRENPQALHQQADVLAAALLRAFHVRRAVVSDANLGPALTAHARMGLADHR